MSGRYEVRWKANGGLCGSGFESREDAERWRRLHCGDMTADVVEVESGLNIGFDHSFDAGDE